MKNKFLQLFNRFTYYSFGVLLFQFVIVCTVFASSQAESQDLRAVKINLSINNGNLEDVFKLITDKTDFSFTYRSDQIPLRQKISLDLKQASLYEVLEHISAECSLKFERINNQIVVTKSMHQRPESTPPETGSVRGKVSDASNGEPLASANILILGTTTGVATDNRGNYEIENLQPGEYTLVVRYVGYKERRISVNIQANRVMELNFQLQPSEIELQEVVVTTSTVIPTPVKKLPNTITVISTRDLERIQPVNVAEAVRLAVPGAIYSDEGVGTSYGAFSVRGVSSVAGAASTMKVYVDGIETSDPAYITYMDPTSISKIEIVPGPEASTIYGSRAISGVMQIFTKQGTGGRAKLSGKVGMTNVDDKYVSSTPVGQEYALNANGGVSIFDYNVGINYQNEPQWIDLFEEQALNLSGSTRFTLANFTGNVSVNVSNRNNSSGWDPLNYKRDKALGRPLNAPNRVTKSTYQTYAINLNYKATDFWSHNVTVGYNSLDRNAYDRSANASLQYYVMDANTERYTAAYNTSVQTTIGQMFETAITVGTDWTQYSLPFFSGYVADRTDYVWVNQNPGYDKNFGFFGQTLISYNDFLFLTGGLRADKRPSGANKDYTWSPRLGLSAVQEFNEWMVKGRVAWGQSVIIPEEGVIIGSESATSVVKPNKDILSEVQRGYEVGADLYYADIAMLSLTYFSQNPLDLIEMVNLGRDDQNRVLYQYQNLSEVKNQGFEIKGIVSPLEWLSVTLNYGQTKSTVEKLGPNYTGDLGLGDEITGRPEYTFSTIINVMPFQGTTLTLSAFHFGDWIAADFYGYLYDVYGGTYNAAVKSYPKGYLITYPGYTKINLGVNQNITERFSAYLRISNLTNTDKFERLNAIVTQPRTVTLGVQFTGFSF